ncbi:hypothetical protein Tco_1086246, partial [Tanacetum coccineum]
VWSLDNNLHHEATTHFRNLSSIGRSSTAESTSARPNATTGIAPPCNTINPVRIEVVVKFLLFVGVLVAATRAVAYKSAQRSSTPQDGWTHVSVATVVVTKGYAAPEYVPTGRLTAKINNIFLKELITQVWGSKSQ